MPFWFWKAVGSTRTCTDGRGDSGRGRNGNALSVAGELEIGIPAARIGDGDGLRDHVAVAESAARHHVAHGGDDAVLLVHSADGEDHHAAIGDGIENVAGSAQNAAAGNIFGNREALLDQQVFGIQNGQDRRRWLAPPA